MTSSIVGGEQIYYHMKLILSGLIFLEKKLITLSEVHQVKVDLPMHILSVSLLDTVIVLMLILSM